MSTAKTGAVAAPQQNTLATFNRFMAGDRTQELLSQVLFEKKAQFINNITTLVANNVGLQSCEPQTIMFAAMKATASNLSLDPNLGQAHVIPYNDKRKGITVATFQVGAKGIKQLAIRSGQFTRLNYGDVREGEIKSKDFLSGDIVFQELKEDRLKAPIIGYFCYARLKNGFEKTLYMTIEEIKAHAQRFSQAYRYGTSLWNKEDGFLAMAKKTVCKLLLNSGDFPLSTELQEVLTADHSVVSDKGCEYVDNSFAPVSETALKAKDFAEDESEIENAEVVEEDGE